MTGVEIKSSLRMMGVKQWQVAEYLDVPETSFSRMLRHEVDSDMTAAIMEAASSISMTNASMKAKGIRAVVIEK